MSNNPREALSIEQRVANQSDLDALTCPICLSLMTAPIKQCLSGHLGCESCLDRVARSTGTCPQCRTPISNGRLSRSLLADHMLSSLRVHCVNQFKYSQESKKWEKDARGCQEITTVATSNDHKTICRYNLLKCGHQGCDVEVLKDDMPGHRAQCKYQSREKISCPFGTDVCAYTGTKTEVDQHILGSLSNHIKANNQRVDEKIKSMELSFEKKFKELIKESNKHTVVQFEWVITNYLSKYRKSMDADSDDFQMGGFTWHLNASMGKPGEPDELGFYLILNDANHKLVKVDFVIDVQFPRLLTAPKGHIDYVFRHKSNGFGYPLGSHHVNHLNHNDSVTVKFKGHVVTVKKN